MPTPPFRLGLIGRGIAHSLSPSLYRQLIGPEIQYDLIDIANENDLPLAEELSLKYQGINITAPWKTHYAAYAVSEMRDLGAVNCLRFTEDRIEATNTDALALKSLLPEMYVRLAIHGPCVLLGDGVMATITKDLLVKLGIPCRQYARSLGHDLGSLDLPKLFPGRETKLLINACGRDFVFQGKLDATWVFWDFNYAHLSHSHALPGHCLRYQDGTELLHRQAEAAVLFWNHTLTH